MQIHELNNFAGTPTSSDYLAIDNSTTTTKIGATGLGVQDKLTVAEANTGTSTASRIVTPKVVHDYVVQDTTHITSATKTKWAGITGDDGSMNNAMDYQADIFGASVLSGSGSETFTSGSSTRRIKILPTLQPGTWIINASVNYTANSTGQRAVEIRVDGTTYGRQATNAVTNLGSALSSSCVVKSSSSMTVELWGFQNSGSNISTAWDYNIVQIK